MRRMQSLIFIAGLMIVVILAGALALASYRSAVVEVEGHEHAHGMAEHEHGTPQGETSMQEPMAPDHHAGEPSKSEEPEHEMSAAGEEEQTVTPAHDHDDHDHQH
ncbi:MAG: hypothetical protein GTO55_01525 [Armatimonadetes bacterium]|nr:hypothetical protein [Armatimonadota bacterium]NIM22957.1 hypothetical protein [Armatimonadota bacterium]NIM66828.1 hypothetical protein [Armatimonadota bacterium]NIM75369.1 hypothetical protein [Armatimonadota bacterium]NIN05016.1 hypothetical protein [Armatimonadota bacterium]